MWHIATLKLCHSSAELFVDEGKNPRRDADNDKGRDCTPDGVAFGKFPDGQNAQNRAGNKREGDDDKRNNADQVGVNNALKFMLDLDNLFLTFPVFHLIDKPNIFSRLLTRLIFSGTVIAPIKSSIFECSTIIHRMNLFEEGLWVEEPIWRSWEALQGLAP